jgi:hypothetical protein
VFACWFLRQGLIMKSRPASNSESSCLSLLSAGISGQFFSVFWFGVGLVWFFDSSHPK